MYVILAFCSYPLKLKTAPKGRFSSLFMFIPALLPAKITVAVYRYGLTVIFTDSASVYDSLEAECERGRVRRQSAMAKGLRKGEAKCLSLFVLKTALRFSPLRFYFRHSIRAPPPRRMKIRLTGDDRGFCTRLRRFGSRVRKTAQNEKRHGKPCRFSILEIFRIATCFTDSKS